MGRVVQQLALRSLSNFLANRPLQLPLSVLPLLPPRLPPLLLPHQWPESTVATIPMVMGPTPLPGNAISVE